ncbi:MAG: phosphotransferase [Alphaproteobacteria bacterium]|nr:phosphotransferase [Alphaproteobacteria bacterium]
MTEEIYGALARMGLIGKDDRPRLEPLPGGVSSNILRVDLPTGPICVKQALAKLKVAQDWRAPVSRNAAELAWLQLAQRLVPASVPRILGHDPAAGLFAMAYLDPERHPVWKAELRDGRIDLATARAVAAAIGRVHAATADDAATAAAFAHDGTFHAIRLEPYLLATARACPDVAAPLEALVARTASTRRALVHGDVSPKNILVGPAGPILLDAECAWFGDPAFDAAFCLNHLLLKGVWRPQHRAAYLQAFAAFAETYLDAAAWEPRAGIESRIATLLPGLLLGRIDGKSPVEYVTAEADRDHVRRFARRFLQAPAERLAAIASAWEQHA